MTRLQLALDMIKPAQAIDLLQRIQADVDIVEIGTPLLIREGLRIVQQLREAFPQMELLCDGKIMDAGFEEAKSMLDAGANWVTVMACTDDATIAHCCEAARLAGGRVMADLLSYTPTPAHIRRLEQLGVDCIAVHVGVDVQARGLTPLQSLTELKACAPACLTAVAGGVTCSSAAAYLALQPDILIVGGGILNAEDPAVAAGQLSFIVHGGDSDLCTSR